MTKIIFNLLLFIGTLNAGELGFGKEYYNIRNTKVKKMAFVNIMLPKIEKAERDILSERKFVKSFFKQYFFTYSFKSRSDIVRLIKISKKYRVKQMYNEAEYLNKIDIVPVSLVLAQSAVESAWGESRFVRKGNNIFGEWTWGKTGLVPQARDENATHKLRVFKSLDASVARYMLNLNRHRSYKAFRDLRAKYRDRGELFSGIAAAKTMTHYSQQREGYTRLIIRVIKDNGFDRYDKAWEHTIHKKPY